MRYIASSASPISINVGNFKLDNTSVRDETTGLKTVDSAISDLKFVKFVLSQHKQAASCTEFMLIDTVCIVTLVSMLEWVIEDYRQRLLMTTDPSGGSGTRRFDWDATYLAWNQLLKQDF